MPPVTRGKN